MVPKRKSIFPSLALLAAMIALLFCSRDYNPYADLTNAKVHVISWSFADKDTVPLYSTGVIKLVVALHEEVEYFTLKAPKNRYWSDTTVRPGMASSGGPYSFSVSFYDTGMQEILVETHRSNGEVVPQIFPIYVTNGLHQAAINSLFGKPFVLATPKVSDVDVLYHWYFGPGRSDSSLSSSFTKTFYYFAPSRDTGYLWATDLGGKHETPKSRFTYSFRDTSKPVIICLDTGKFNGDTLLLGDTSLVFKVRITDSGTDKIDSCSINGQPFETENSRDHTYTRIFNNLPVLTRDAPLKLTVFARDNPDSPNISMRTFWVKFLAGGVKNPTVELQIVVPATTNSAVGTRNYTVSGRIKSYFAAPRALNLKMWVNGVQMPDVKKFSDSVDFWQWDVYLGQQSNSIVAKVEDTAGDSLAVASRTIVYDPDVKDIIDPLIYEVYDSADGRRLDNTSLAVSTSKSTMTLKIIAFDDGSGIHDLSLNGFPTQKSTQSRYIWYGRVLNILHNIQGTKCVIKVTDNDNNFSEKTITLIKNTPPVLESSPDIPPVLCTDSTYRFHLMYFDADDDPVTVSWRSKPGSMDTVQNNTITWRPTASDRGADSVILQGSDVYSVSEWFQRTFTVENCTQRNPVHFVTREQDFPSVLQADHDILSIQLKTDTTPMGLRYSAKFLDRVQPDLKRSDSSASLAWLPTLADTGYRRLMITVGDRDTTWDALTATFWVVPKNQYPCSLSYRFTGTKTAGNELDLFSHPAAETLYFAIHDKDNPLTEKYTVSITQNRVNSVQVLDKGDFFIVIKPDSMRALDTLRVLVLDKTGTTDSSEIVIRYAGQRANRKPVLLTDPGFPAWFCIDSSYRYTIVPFDSDNDVVDVEAILKPDGMTVSSRGVIEWTPAVADTGDKSLVLWFFDGKDYSAGTYSWLLPVVNCAMLPPGVKFRTTPADFPSVLMMGDSIRLPLSIVAGTGVAPFYYSARFIDNGYPVLSNSTDSQLVWKPSLADTGTRVLMVSVADRFGRKDSIMTVIKVVPRNQYLCSLSYVYSGTTVSPGVMQIMYPAPPETFTFTIRDLDHPLTERYTVDIVKDRMRSTQVLTGATRSFTVTVSSSAVTTVDTIRVKIRDATGSADSMTAAIRYIGRPLLHLQLNTTAPGAGVTTNQINFPVLVRLTRSNFDFSKALRNGQDIVCRKPNGVVLPHEIEQWDSLNGTAAVWVKADTVFGNDSTHFINLTGSEDLGTAQSDPNAVFDTASAFCGVWHLNENPAGGVGSIKDRTAFENNGTSYGIMTPLDQTAGIIGNGMNFNGNNAYVSFGDINQVDGLTRLTASAWIKPAGLKDFAQIIGKAIQMNNQWAIVESGMTISNNADFLVSARNNGSSSTMDGYTSGNLLSIGNWYFCVMVYDGTQLSNTNRLKFYFNGVQQPLSMRGTIPNRLQSTADAVELARNTLVNNFFNGVIDEAVIARNARSADWVKLCYMNQKAVDALVKVR